MRKIENFFVNNYLEDTLNSQVEISNIINNLEKNRKKITLQGYFQDFSFFTDSNSESLELKSPSKWFKDIEKRILEIDPIVLHLRFGDYLKNLEVFGVLSAKYYKRAIEHAENLFPNREIWVFTNDFEAARVWLKNSPQVNLRFCESSSEQDAAEVLTLMSRARVHLVSNSSFSFWAAMFSVNPVYVAIPNPVFRTHELSFRNIPSSWIRFPAEWASEDEIKLIQDQ
jgi:hypothetical protein